MDLSPVFIVEDDEEDAEFIRMAAQKIDFKRSILFFKNGDEVLLHLLKDLPPPFLILSDLNLPGKSGFEIKKQIFDTEELRYKGVPFIFWLTDASEKQIQHAYDFPVQGFFFKPMDFASLCETFKMIMDYWEKSQHQKKVI